MNIKLNLCERVVEHSHYTTFVVEEEKNYEKLKKKNLVNLRK